MKISHRLLAQAGITALGLVCVAAVSVWSVTSIQTDLRALTTQAGPLQTKTYELQERTERAVGGLLKLSLARNKDEAARAGAELTRLDAGIGKLRDELRALDPKTASSQTLDLAGTQREIMAAVERRLGDDEAYRVEAEQARAALKKAEDAVGATRSAVQQIGVEAGQAADRAQDQSRRIGQTVKQLLSAQTRLKELAIVVGDVDTVTSRFRLAPIKERAKAVTDAIARLEPEAGTEDALKEVRALAAATYEQIAKDNGGLLALRAAALAAKPEAKAEAEAAYQKQRRAVLGPADEQATKLGTVIDTLEVQAVKQRQALEAALRLRNEPGGVVTTSEEVSLAIRDMVAQLRLLMLAGTVEEAAATQGALEAGADKLVRQMKAMREGLVRMGRPPLAMQVDAALAAMESVRASIGKVGAAKKSLLGSEAHMAGMLDKLKQTALAQAAAGEKQVQAIAERQRQVSAGVDGRVNSSLTIILGIAALVIVATGLFSLRTVRAVTARLNGAVQVAESVSSGHLVDVPRVSGNDETARLMNAMATMVDKLRGIVGDISQAAQQIHSGSAEINRGNQDLSERTEQQASQLQQTAASVEQLASTVRSNAESARSANELAGSASEVATRGGAVVEQVVSTMAEIEAQSKRIGDIVGVIDGIAFQTNILALNAAVEAARAGEHGRGFAVVAAEVRALAAKSADAARQVKAIVEASVSRIDGGSALVRDAGTTMQEIVTQVQRVTQIMAEIARASEEQATSVGTVGSAVNQLDTLTQQNAALAEQSTAAAASLTQLAEGLTQAVAAFRLETGPGTQGAQAA